MTVNERVEGAKSAKRSGAVAILPKPPFRLDGREPLDFNSLEVLVIRRSEFVAAPGALCFPGGGVEPGEAPDEAVRREFLEEVGLKVKVGARIAENRTPAGAPLYWFAAEFDGAPDELEVKVQPEEVAGFEWRTLPSLLGDSDFLANNLEIVRGIVVGEIGLR